MCTHSTFMHSASHLGTWVSSQTFMRVGDHGSRQQTPQSSACYALLSINYRSVCLKWYCLLHVPSVSGGPVLAVVTIRGPVSCLLSRPSCITTRML